jgi:hypothetical protein
VSGFGAIADDEMIDREFGNVKLFHVTKFQFEFADGELSDCESADGDGTEGDGSDHCGTEGRCTGCYTDFDDGSCARAWKESHAGIVVPVGWLVVMCRSGAGASTARCREGGP